MADQMTKAASGSWTLTYTSIDGCRITRTFKTLKRAKAWAIYWIGERPERGRSYAVSSDGVGKISGDIDELFPD